MKCDDKMLICLKQKGNSLANFDINTRLTSYQHDEYSLNYCFSKIKV